MKRFSIFLLVAILAAGVVSAQAIQDKGSTNQATQNKSSAKNKPESVTVEGTLTLEKGMISVTSGDNVYFVPSLSRLAGFIDGLKEGNKISVEGFVFRNYIHPAKITLNGKSYDFPANSPKRMSGDFKQGFDKGQRGHNPGHNKHGYGKNGKNHKFDKYGHGRNGKGHGRNEGSHNRGDNRGKNNRPDGAKNKNNPDDVKGKNNRSQGSTL